MEDKKIRKLLNSIGVDENTKEVLYNDGTVSDFKANNLPDDFYVAPAFNTKKKLNKKMFANGELFIDDKYGTYKKVYDNDLRAITGMLLGRIFNDKDRCIIKTHPSDITTAETVYNKSYVLPKNVADHIKFQNFHKCSIRFLDVIPGPEAECKSIELGTECNLSAKDMIIIPTSKGPKLNEVDLENSGMCNQSIECVKFEADNFFLTEVASIKTDDSLLIKKIFPQSKKTGITLESDNEIDITLDSSFGSDYQDGLMINATAPKISYRLNGSIEQPIYLNEIVTDVLNIGCGYPINIKLLGSLSSDTVQIVALEYLETEINIEEISSLTGQLTFDFIGLDLKVKYKGKPVKDGETVNA